MTIPGQSQDDAARNAGTFINQNLDAARSNFTHHGLDSSLYDFGRAFHTVSDMTSPMHEGYQVWNWTEANAHKNGEAKIYPYQMGLAVGATLALYRYTYGDEQLRAATGYTPGGEDDPTVQAIRAEFRLAGSSNQVTEEALYNYRLGLTAGFNFDWGRQWGLRR